jgi:F-type H+-transporting ATPase subunit delta
MSQIKIAKRYAQALFDSANETEKLAVLEDIKAVEILLHENTQLNKLLNDESVSAKVKTDALAHIFSKATPLFKQILSLLCSKRRESVLPDLIQSYIALYNTSKQIVQVHIKSSVPIQPSTEEEVRNIVQKTTSAKEIQITNEIDSHLMGGLIIRFGDTLIDTSIKSKLTKLKQEFNIA